MTLYEIAKDLRTFLENMDVDEDGCIVNAEELNNLQAAFEDKAEAVACYIKELDAEAEALKKQIEGVQARKKTKEKNAEHMREYLKNMLLAVGRTKFETPQCKLSFRKSESVNVPKELEKLLPDEYSKIERSADKKALKDALKEGKVIEGVTLEVKQNLQIK